MTRRRQALTLEFEYERKTLELRHQFELPSTKRGISTLTIPYANSPTRSVVHPIQHPAAEQLVGVDDMGTVKKISPGSNMTSPAPGLRIMGASRNSSIAPNLDSKPDAASQRRSTTTGSSSKRHTSPALTEQIDEPYKVDSTKRPEEFISEKEKGQISSSSASVHIKTLVSPVPVRRDGTDLDKPRWPKITHLTCYFWKNGHCTKSAAECSYAHHDTGAVAMAPESMRRMKQDDYFYKPRAW